jgi:hypothetical protein
VFYRNRFFQNKDLAERVIAGFYTGNPAFTSMLAKAWYLNYGNPQFLNYCPQQYFIFPELSYGFSIEEFAAYNNYPKFAKEILTSRAQASLTSRMQESMILPDCVI